MWLEAINYLVSTRRLQEVAQWSDSVAEKVQLLISQDINQVLIYILCVIPQTDLDAVIQIIRNSWNLDDFKARFLEIDVDDIKDALNYSLLVQKLWIESE